MLGIPRVYRLPEGSNFLAVALCSEDPTLEDLTNEQPRWSLSALVKPFSTSSQESREGTEATMLRLTFRFVYVSPIYII